MTETTALLGGTRVQKYDLRIEAYGTVDELNAHLGLISDQQAALEYKAILRSVQEKLFVIGSMLATDPGKSSVKIPSIEAGDVDLLEKAIDHMNEDLPELKNFILPGGHPVSSMAHIARCICRRAERRVVELNKHASVDPLILQYLNRLSDWLFVLSRSISHKTHSAEVLWNA